MPEPLSLTSLDSNNLQAQKPSPVVGQSVEGEKTNPKSIGVFNSNRAESSAIVPNASVSTSGGDVTSKLSGFFKGLVQKKQENSIPLSNSPSISQVLTPQPLSRSSVSNNTLPLTPLSSPVPSAAPRLNANQTMQTSQVAETNKMSQGDVKSGNLFTRLFKGSKVDEEGGSIIDAIVSKEEEERKREKQLKIANKQAKKALKNPPDGLGLFRASRLFLHFTLLFIVVGTTFLYIQIVDVNNSVFSWFNGPQNYASRLNESESQLQELQRQEAQLKGDVTRFQEGYKDPNEAVVTQIVQKRSSWPEVEGQLYGAAKQLYPLNDFFNYLEYTNFNLNFEAQQVSFTASLKDPSGNNFSSLADFEKILKSYPGDPDQDDGVKPYFTDLQDITNYSERYDANTDTYETVFSMTAKINSDAL